MDLLDNEANNHQITHVHLTTEVSLTKVSRVAKYRSIILKKSFLRNLTAIYSETEISIIKHKSIVPVDVVLSGDIQRKRSMSHVERAALAVVIFCLLLIILMAVTVALLIYQLHINSQQQVTRSDRLTTLVKCLSLIFSLS